jgi:hypothetical protein
LAVTPWNTPPSPSSRLLVRPRRGVPLDAAGGQTCAALPRDGVRLVASHAALAG